MASPNKTVTRTVTRTVTSSYANVDIQNEAYKAEIENQANINRALRAQIGNFQSMQGEIARLDARLVDSEQCRVDIQTKLDQAEKTNQDYKAEALKTQEKLKKENAALRKTIDDLQKKAFEQEQRHTKDIGDQNIAHHERQQKYVREIETLKESHKFELETWRKDHKKNTDERDKNHADEMARLKAENAENMRRMQATIDAKDKMMAEQAKAHSADLRKQQAEHNAWQDKHNKELKARLFQMQLELQLQAKALNAQIAAQRNEREADRAKFTAVIDNLTNVNRDQLAQITDLTSQVQQLTMKLQRLSEVERQLLASKDSEARMHQNLLSLQAQLDECTRHIHEIQEQNLESKRKCIEILKELQQVQYECEQYQIEIENLKNYIIDLKSRIAVYIPVKEDRIDKKIAEYINNYPDRQKLKILFMRESEGVYQFGSKRVMVKIDKDKINIRVGGGYLSIDEFLDQYTPTELEKLERKDPMKKFTERVSVTKQLQNYNKVRDMSPDSPDKRPRTSPMKQQRI